jgi:hypothetical protein
MAMPLALIQCCRARRLNSFIQHFTKGHGDKTVSREDPNIPNFERAQPHLMPGLTYTYFFTAASNLTMYDKLLDSSTASAFIKIPNEETKR